MNNINIIFMGNFLYPEGMAETKRIQHFADYVKSVEGVDVSILLLRQGHVGRDDARLSGIHNNIPYKTIGSDLKKGILLPYAVVRYLIQGAIYLLKKYNRKQLNIIYLYSEPNIENFYFILLARIIGYRVIVDVTEDFYFIADHASWLSRLKAISVQFLSKNIAWFADAIVTISSHLQSKYESISRGRFPVSLISISVNLSNISALNETFHNPVRIFYAGSFGEKDGVENLIEAFELISIKHSNIELLLTGKGMPERMNRVLNRIRNSPCSGKIHYLGYLSDKDYFTQLQVCDIPCAVRVDSEFANRGFPFKLGEYLATGRPVIASNIGDVPFYLENKKTALLVEPGSISSIAEALDYILNNESDALSIGNVGKSVAEENFNFITNGKKLFDLIDQFKLDY